MGGSEIRGRGDEVDSVISNNICLTADEISWLALQYGNLLWDVVGSEIRGWGDEFDSVISNNICLTADEISWLALQKGNSLWDVVVRWILVYL